MEKMRKTSKAKAKHKGGAGDGISVDKNGLYRFRVIRDKKDIVRTGFKTKTDAKNARIRFLAEYEEEKAKASAPMVAQVDDPTVTVDFVWNEFLKTGAMERRQSTITKYQSIYTHHIQPIFGQRPLVSITSSELNNFFSTLYRRGSAYNNYSSGYSFKYVEGFIKFFHLIFGNALSMGKITRDTYTYFTSDKHTKMVMPKITQEDAMDYKEVQVYTKDEIAQMREVIQGSNLHLAFEIGCYCGLRIGEIFGLMWQDVNFANSTITIRRQMILEENQSRVLYPPKTLAGQRTILVPNTLLALLKEKKAEQEGERKTMGRSYRNTELVVDKTGKAENEVIGGDFVNRRTNGEILTPNSFKAWRLKIKDKTGIDFKVHHLRHTHATELASLGIPSTALLERMGHTKMETTLKYYIGTSETAEEKMKLLLNAM